jgi:asparagine synthase (glutamine-hydrolysing)
VECYSIENRSPFLDRRLFETIAQVPTRHMMRNGYAKALLREAARGIAPDVVIDCRQKIEFNAPVLDLLDVHDPEVRGELLEDSPIFEVVRRDAMESWLNKNELTNSESKFLFDVLNTKMFLEISGAEVA